jgi:hypothetical protein
MTPVPLGGDDDQHADKDEYGRPDKAVKRNIGVIVLYEEESADKDERQPGAAPEIMPHSYEEAGGYHYDIPPE